MSIEIPGQVVPVESLLEGGPARGRGDRLVAGLVERVGDDLARRREGGDGLGRGRGCSFDEQEGVAVHLLVVIG